MNKGVIFFIVVVLVVLAVIFIPKNNDSVPADSTMETVAEDLQGTAIEAVPLGEFQVETSAELPAVDAGTEGVVEVPTTEATPAAE